MTQRDRARLKRLEAKYSVSEKSGVSTLMQYECHKDVGTLFSIVYHLIKELNASQRRVRELEKAVKEHP